MKAIKYISLIISILLTHLVIAQDVHFSKFYTAPLILNPANNGNYVGNWRVISNYRTQGTNSADAYRTASLTFDHPVYYHSEKASVGFIFIHDNSADNTLNVNKIYLSAAYFKKVSRYSYLHVGFQAGYVNKSYSLRYLSFPDQFDMGVGYFNPNAATQERLENMSLSYLDLNWGLIWSRISPQLKSEIGVAMFHYNTPQEVFFNADNSLPIRYLTHAYFEKKFQNKYYIKPKLLYTYQKGASEMLFGLDLMLAIENASVKNVSIGSFFRSGSGEASHVLILKTGINYRNYTFSFSYDFDVSQQSISSVFKTAFEISLTYTRPSTDVKQIAIPCEIY